jgi:hypothetical protein
MSYSQSLFERVFIQSHPASMIGRRLEDGENGYSQLETAIMYCYDLSSSYADDGWPTVIFFNLKRIRL